MTTANTILPPVSSNAEPSVGGNLLTYKLAADWLGCSERSVFTLVKTGQLPAVRFGGLVRIDPTDLDAFIERAKVRQQTPGAKALAVALDKLTPEQRERFEQRIAETKAGQPVISG